MHDVSTTFKNKFKKAYSASSKPKVLIEWNQNRFGFVDKLTNNGVEPDDDDPVFPLSSIIAPRRPGRAAIIKGVVTTGSGGQEAPLRTSSSIPTWRRTYVATPDDKYKYWLSPNVSSTTLASGGYAISNCTPSVTYLYGLSTNKLVAQFENSGSSPVGVQIQVTTNGTTWVNAGTTQNTNNKGRIELFLQDNGTWSPTPNYKNMQRLRGIRAIVNKMDKPRVHCHVIEIALMFEIDVTSRTISYETSTTASEASFVAPLGRAESGTGSLTLSNVDGYFDNDRNGQDLYGMMNSPAKVTVTLETTVDGTTETTPQMVKFVDNWGDQAEDRRTLAVEDASLFLKREKPTAFILRDVTATEAIWRLLDSIGFTEFRVDESPAGDIKIPFFWSDPDKTVWDHIKELSEGLQIACYFDEIGIMRIKTRDMMYEADADKSVWTFDGQKVTQALADANARAADVGKITDIIDISKPAELFANKVTVEFQETSVSDINKHIPEMEQVWAPEDTIVIRSASLAKLMSPTSTYGDFSGSNFATWPYEGYLQMEGEIVKWTRKRYKYVDTDGSWKRSWISSDAEKDVLDSKNTYKSHMNKFDGGLYFGTNRGIMSTLARTHDPRGAKFNVIRARHKDGPWVTSNWYTKTDYANSMFRISTTKVFTTSSWVTARRGSTVEAAPHYMGTSLRFHKSSYPHGMAGIWIGGEANDVGYYLEVRLTSSITDRKRSNEICLYVRNADGSVNRIVTGATASIVKGKWYDIDIFQEPIPYGGHQFHVMINGVSVMNPRVLAKDAIDPVMGGIYGVFARGQTKVDFEYLYAANSLEDAPYGGDDASRFDLIEGGYRSNYYNRYLYRARINERISRYSKNRYTKNTGFFFDDFGVEAHELRKFEVQFEPNPVIHSRLYSSNEWYADCLEYFADHNSANFIMTSKGRNTVILNGEDTLLYGADNSVEQKLFIYGRVVKQGDTEKYEVSNEKSIKRTGEVELTVSSPWLQSRPAAKKIGDWIADHWANGSEVLEITSFGNPLLQIGDIVKVHYERKSMLPAKHEYYITGIRHQYSEGLSSTFTLQRKTNLIA